MKKIIALTLLLTICCCTIFCLPAGAASSTKVTVEKLDNGDYIETIITYYESNDRTATKSGSKTSNYKNGDGDLLWSITVNGTFTYNGTTSSCTSVSRSASAYADNWSIKSSSCSKSGNCASASAVAAYKTLLISREYTMTVDLYCSPYGILS